MRASHSFGRPLKHALKLCLGQAGGFARWLIVAAMPIAPAGALVPCCGVVSVDQSKGLVTIRNFQTGAINTVRVRDVAVLRQLRIGTKVQANGLPAR